ncbi:putative proton-dependent oligopeptide transporter family, major facilitator superfamily [Lupinus albus]|uniref:Putative proton-dependent oligopeptide transporter family, major facilitator superfamily n=1 Tax=Lupinus albus TaxID=3870 RepID=A0A6A4Q2Q1_LUPAL|nr:putative proton-dependent oligopeptide transporter family, major facilitator superfamily [Lupinus albus]
MLVSKDKERTKSEYDSKESEEEKPKMKRGGWKAMPYILGNETFERLASFGLFTNFIVYLTRELHLDDVNASNIINIWFGITNFAPLIGAFISDAYIGRFRTIAYASCSTLLVSSSHLYSLSTSFLIIFL